MERDKTGKRVLSSKQSAQSASVFVHTPCRTSRKEHENKDEICCPRLRQKHKMNRYDKIRAREGEKRQRVFKRRRMFFLW
jgi:predicted metal-binding protein